MADTALSALTATTSLTTGDLLYAVDGGSSRKIDFDDLVTSIEAVISIDHGGTVGTGDDDHTQYAIISSGAGAPGTTPARVGAVYVDTTADVPYLAVGSASSADWMKVQAPFRRYIQATVFEYATDVATGDGKFYMHIPSELGGMNLAEVHAKVITAGTTGTTDVQIHNVTQAADMLSTKLTIDSAETGSDTAAAAAVIDATNDDVAENDLLRIDVDAVSTTAPKGLIVTLGFESP